MILSMAVSHNGWRESVNLEAISIYAVVNVAPECGLKNWHSGVRYKKREKQFLCKPKCNNSKQDVKWVLIVRSQWQPAWRSLGERKVCAFCFKPGLLISWLVGAGLDIENTWGMFYAPSTPPCHCPADMRGGWRQKYIWNTFCSEPASPPPHFCWQFLETYCTCLGQFLLLFVCWIMLKTKVLVTVPAWSNSFILCVDLYCCKLLW